MKNITVEQRFVRASLVGSAGGLVALAIALNDRHMGMEDGFIRVATAGAFLAGWILARGFGTPGVWAPFRAGITFGLATVLGAVLAVMLLPLDFLLSAPLTWLSIHLGMVGLSPEFLGFSLMGPAYVFSMMAENGFVTTAWLSGLMAVIAISRPGG